MSQCRSCHNKLERQRRSHVRGAARSKAIRKGFTRLLRAPTDRVVATVCDDLVQGFGGLQAFYSSWITCLRRDLDRGGHAALRHLEGVLRLAQYCDQHRPNAGSMTDEELEAAIAAYPDGE
jgi:hypothetical protein